MGMASAMSEREKTEGTEPQEREPVGEGVRQDPRGNPDIDQEALDKGRETLERVKPY